MAASVNTARHNYNKELVHISKLAFTMRIHPNLVAFRTKEYIASTEDPTTKSQCWASHSRCAVTELVHR